MVIDKFMEAEWRIYASVNEAISGPGSSAPMNCLYLYHEYPVRRWTLWNNITEIYVEIVIRCVSNTHGDGLKAQINIFSFLLLTLWPYET